MTDSSRRNFLIVLLLFTTALILRMTGLLTYICLDENWGIPVRVLTGEFSPNTYFYPPLFAYLCAASYVLMFAFGRLVGIWYSTADFRSQYFADPRPFIFLGRFLAAFFGSLSVPLAVMLSRQLSLSWRHALLVGLMVCLFPVDVYLSHFGKSDAAAASAVLFLAWSILRKLDDPDARGADVLIGVAAAVAVSFKQTTVFVVITAIIGMAASLCWGNGLPFLRVVRGLVLSLLAAIPSWLAMNFGIFLDLKNFLEYQGLLRQMYSKSDSIVGIASRFLVMLGGNAHGLTLPGLVAGLLAVFFRRDRKFLILWFSAVFSLVAFAALAGRRLVVQHYLSPNLLLFTLACIAVVTLLERQGFLRGIGVLGTGAILSCAIFGSFQVVTQAMRIPTRFMIAEALRKTCNPDREKILGTTGDLGLPISGAALKDERDRHERLAKKYGVELPIIPPEKTKALAESTGRYYIRGIPWVMGGMEGLSPEDIKIVKPFAWPIQHEEWKFDYWVERGFNIFVIGDPADLLNNPVEDYRSFATELLQRCDLIEVVRNARPLFDTSASEYRIYKLRVREIIGVSSFFGRLLGSGATAEIIGVSSFLPLLSAAVDRKPRIVPVAPSMGACGQTEFQVNLSRVGKGRPAGSIELRVSPSPSKISYGGFSPGEGKRDITDIALLRGEGASGACR